jgi:hypothetical protein
LYYSGRSIEKAALLCGKDSTSERDEEIKRVYFLLTDHEEGSTTEKACVDARTEKKRAAEEVNASFLLSSRAKLSFMQIPPISDNPEALLAERLIENTDTHVFLTGKAGTGKTTFLQRLRQHSAKRMVVLAPTGIAAINAGGTTLHSFFQLPMAPFVPSASPTGESFKMGAKKLRLIRSLDLVVIDEISMVRADILDRVDAVLQLYRRNREPFGGVQLLLIGDLGQLSPVVRPNDWELLKEHYSTPYFFGSHALEKASYATITLQHIYRQTDERFVSLLNAIREGHPSARDLAHLNTRYLPGFIPAEEDGYIRLVTHNHQAGQINERELERLGGECATFSAKITGEFPESNYPTEETLQLKTGAQIMFIKNDATRGIYNGMIGRVVHIHAHALDVRPVQEDRIIRVEPAEWSNVRYRLNEKTGEVEEEVIGIFVQYPVRLAWAITIHKSQGLTFDHALIDVQWSFAHGQTYVALSRCKTLEGLVLAAPVPARAVICDQQVEQFSRAADLNSPKEDTVQVMEAAYYYRILGDLFDFSALGVVLKGLQEYGEQHFAKTLPKSVGLLRTAYDDLHTKVLDVSDRFHHQWRKMLHAAGLAYATDEALQGRLRAGAHYFEEHISDLQDRLEGIHFPTDSKELQAREKNLTTRLQDILRTKLRLLHLVGEEGLTLSKYLRVKHQDILEEATATKRGKAAATAKTRPATATSESVSSDIPHPQLYQKLIQWRAQRARALQVPAYVVLQQQALIGIAATTPHTVKELSATPHVGKVTMERYGNEILRMVADYLATSSKEPTIF